MILGTGIDLAHLSRIEEAMNRLGDRFRDRIFTEEEIRYCESKSHPFESYAARFAAKEAAMKALGTGWSSGGGWREIEVITSDHGPPRIRLAGNALKRFEQIGASTIHLSISHSDDLAIAQVILESE